MPHEFTVIGQHKEDESQLLVVGEDGKYYGFNLDREQLAPVKPDEHWLVEGTQDETEGSSLAPEVEPLS